MERLRRKRISEKIRESLYMRFLAEKEKHAVDKDRSR